VAEDWVVASENSALPSQEVEHVYFCESLLFVLGILLYLHIYLKYTLPQEKLVTLGIPLKTLNWIQETWLWLCTPHCTLTLAGTP